MADLVSVAVKHVQHRLLLAIGGLGQVVAVIDGPGPRQQARPPPATFGGEGQEALDRRPGSNREIDPLGGVLSRAFQLIDKGGARRARALHQRQQRGLPARVPRSAPAAS